MITEPEKASRATVHYAAVRTTTTMADIANELPVLWPKVYGWIVAQGSTPAGAPFIHYHSMGDRLDVSVGIPTQGPLHGDEEVETGVFTEGDYLSTVLTGPFDQLPQTHARVHEWAEANGLTLGWPRENYLTDPGEEPDSAKWQTEVLYEIVAT